MSAIHPSAAVESDAIGAGASIGEFAVVRAGAKVGEGAIIHPNVVIEPGVEIGAGTEIMPGAHIGRRPKAVGAVGRQPTFRETLSIGAGCAIGPNAVIYYEVQIGDEVLIAEGASIRERTQIANGCVIGRNTTTDSETEIGERARIMSNVVLVARIKIEKGVFIGPSVVTTNDDAMGREGFSEEALEPQTIEEGAAIGGNATLLPGIRIGRGATVGAGSVVTKDVAAGTTVVGVPARPL
jgi:UDP-3-O-[3-hydroxymyristoyl] glucosamine N-acyltransferase